MNFQPVIPVSGLAGWRFLQRTYDAQFAAFNNMPHSTRDTAYFSEQIGSISTARQLVEDRRLLGVALGAFGLSEDLNNRYFIRKVLEDGTADDSALANRLTDDRYKRLSAAFGFGPGETPRTRSREEMSAVVRLYRVQSFEAAVGEQDDTMRIALFAGRELEKLASDPMGEDARWYSIMALPPLRKMFETALGLPASFGQIDIDRQLSVFRERTGAALGKTTVGQFADPEPLEKLTTLYLARAQIASFDSALSPGSTVLTLLQSAV